MRVSEEPSRGLHTDLAAARCPQGVSTFFSHCFCGAKRGKDVNRFESIEKLTTIDLLRLRCLT